MNKAALRQEFLQKRKQVDTTWLAEQNASINANLEKYLSTKAFGTIHTFLPQENSREVDTWKIIEMVRTRFPQTSVTVPYVIPGTREMEHYLLTLESKLIVNKWNIPEPDPLTAKQVAPDQIDIILIPLLVFDEKGYRVGYGGGYYDRFLKLVRPDTVKIGLSFFGPVEGIGDLDQYDIPLDSCITPDRFYHFQ